MKFTNRLREVIQQKGRYMFSGKYCKKYVYIQLGNENRHLDGGDS